MTKELRKCFIQFDTNGDGRLDRDELISGLKMVDTKKDLEQEVDRVMKIIDVDGNGFIEYEEFLRASLDKDKILTPENVKIVFQLFDINKTGSISPTELKKVMGQNADFYVLNCRSNRGSRLFGKSAEKHRMDQEQMLYTAYNQCVRYQLQRLLHTVWLKG